MSTKTKETSLNREEKGTEIKHENKNVDKRKEESGKLGFLWKFIGVSAAAMSSMSFYHIGYGIDLVNIHLKSHYQESSAPFNSHVILQSQRFRMSPNMDCFTQLKSKEGQEIKWFMLGRQ